MNPDLTRRSILVGCGSALFSVAAGSVAAAEPMRATASPPARRGRTRRSQDGPEFVEYTNSQYLYSLSYPERWTVDDAEPSSVLFYHRTVVMSVTVATQELPLEEIVDRQTAISERLFERYEVLEEEEITLESGQDAIVLDQRGGTEQALETYLKSLVTTEHGLWYGINIMVATSEHTDETEAVFDEIVSSFTIHDSEE